jgi:hypothetical protein
MPPIGYGTRWNERQQQVHGYRPGHIRAFCERAHRIEIGNLCGFGSRKVMIMRKVGVKEPIAMALRLLMGVNVEKRRLHESKRQHQVHQDGDTEPRTHIVPFRDWSYLKQLPMIL